MDQPGKVRQISKKEAKEIDPKKVAYFTLNDGTVFIVKDNLAESQNLPEQNISQTQQIQTEQQKELIQTTSQNDQMVNIIQTQSQNTQEVPQLESNFGYNISSEGENLQQNSGINMNAKLVNAQVFTQGQIQGQGQRRQLYKLIEAIPVRFCDIQGVQFMNQTNNIQLNLQQYNNDTYVVEKSQRENSSNFQINTLSSEKKCNCKSQVKQEVKCCCPIGNPSLREEMEIVSPEIAEKYFEYMKMKESNLRKNIFN